LNREIECFDCQNSYGDPNCIHASLRKENSRRWSAGNINSYTTADILINERIFKAL